MEVRGQSYWMLASILRQLEEKEVGVEDAIRVLRDVLQFDCPYCEEPVLGEEVCPWCAQPLKDFIEEGVIEYQVSYRDEFFAFVRAESPADAIEKFYTTPLVIGELWEEFFEVEPEPDRFLERR